MKKSGLVLFVVAILLGHVFSNIAKCAEYPSPDGKKMVFHKNDNKLYLRTSGRGKLIVLCSQTYGMFMGWDKSSAHIVFNCDNPNISEAGYDNVFFFDIKNGKKVKLITLKQPPDKLEGDGYDVNNVKILKDRITFTVAGEYVDNPSDKRMKSKDCWTRLQYRQTLHYEKGFDGKDLKKPTKGIVGVCPQ